MEDHAWKEKLVMVRTRVESTAMNPGMRRGTHTSSVAMNYEELLAADLEWAMSEGSRFFEERSAVQEALRRITSRLKELGIEYAVVGGMALFKHGFRRFTEDVDLLVTREGLKQIHRSLHGLGYRPPFEGSKNLRDTENGVKIEFLVSGEYPGDGKPKPVAFPEPAGNTIEHNGIQYINLERLVELKLASGMSNAERMKDLADIVELIKNIGLNRDFAGRLNEYVRPKYVELWMAAHPPTRRYIKFLNEEEVGSGESSIETIMERLASTSQEYRSMFAEGVKLERTRSGSSKRVQFVTENPAIARRFDMHEASEYLIDEV